MKHILLTGLDGSGKSFLLNRLENFYKNKPVFFLRVPKIDSSLFLSQPLLYKSTCFINNLHTEADRLKMPQLKAVALFSAMLVFKNLLNELKKHEPQLLFSERHPLLDTAVYARFYTGKMDPDTMNAEVLASISKQYNGEIIFLQHLAGINNAGKNSLYTLLRFIHEWFSVNKKYELPDLEKLFNIDLPDHIIYLSAEPETLMHRLTNRHVLEPHESAEVFKKLIPVYDDVLQQSGITVTKINANNFNNLDKAFENIVLNFHLNNER